MLEILKKELKLRGHDVVDALITKGENGDVSAIKLMFELTKAGAPPDEHTADFSSMSDAELLLWLEGGSAAAPV